MVGLVAEHDLWKGSDAGKCVCIGVLGRVGDNHQIFPEDGHRVAFADLGVNA